VSPRWRRRIAWVILLVSLIGWPVSMFTVARGEPPFILSLSWLALTLTAADILASTDVRVQQDEDK
jgi:hypothetical protein